MDTTTKILALSGALLVVAILIEIIGGYKTRRERRRDREQVKRSITNHQRTNHN